MTARTFLAALVLVAAGCAHTPAPAPAGPVADHHQHILSAAAADLGSEVALPAIELPNDLARVLSVRSEKWNDRAALAELYTEDGMVLERGGTWIRGRSAVGEYLGTLYARAYRVTPVAYRMSGDAAHIAGYFTRGEGKELRHFGHVLLSLEKGSDGVWRVAAETPTFPGPTVLKANTAEERIAEMDAAGIRRAAVLSTAYWFGGPLWKKPIENEYEKVRAENDFTVSEVSRFPDRLVALCSFNPLKDYALEELERCAKMPQVKGFKLHFGNSRVDVFDPEHVEKVRRVFRAANDRKMAIVAHLWTSQGSYGRGNAEIFLNRILPEAPDVTVQIAHFAGGGPGYSDPALAVFADAIGKNDPRTKNLYFDVATVADGQSDEALRKFASRIREVGLKRVLFGTDLAPPPARQSWATFRNSVPLTDEELRTIASNVAPYLR